MKVANNMRCMPTAANFMISKINLSFYLPITLEGSFCALVVT